MDALTFVSFGIAKENTFCNCCNAPIKYVVTLSDNKRYGKDCAKRLTGDKKIDYAEKEYFAKNNPFFKIGIRYGENIVPQGTIQALVEKDALKRYHKIYNSNKNMSIFKGARCLFRGKTLGTQYKTTLDKFLILLS